MELAREILGVLIVLAILAGLLWAGRKKGTLFGRSTAGREGRRLELLERLPLTPQHSVHLLRVGDRTLLIGVHGSGLTILCDFSKPGLTQS